MTIADVLNSLTARLTAAVPEAAVRRWSGAWDALDSPGQVMLAAGRPNVLVSALAVRLVRVGRSPNVAGALRSSVAQAPYADNGTPMVRPFPSGGPDGDGDGPLAATPPPGAVPIVRIQVAVTIVTSMASDGDRDERTDAALRIVGLALPALVDGAVTDVEGTSLYSEALAAKGLMAFALVGRREVAIAPPAAPAERPARVDLGDESHGPVRTYPVVPAD